MMALSSYLLFQIFLFSSSNEIAHKCYETLLHTRKYLLFLIPVIFHKLPIFDIIFLKDFPRNSQSLNCVCFYLGVTSHDALGLLLTLCSGILPGAIEGVGDQTQMSKTSVLHISCTISPIPRVLSQSYEGGDIIPS